MVEKSGVEKSGVKKFTVEKSGVEKSGFGKFMVESPGLKGLGQRYAYRVLQTIQMEVILLWVWAEGAVLGRAKTALKFKYEI